MAGLEIGRVAAPQLVAQLGDFAELLRECVVAGASVGFLDPLAHATAVAFWRDSVVPGVAAEQRLLLAA